MTAKQFWVCAALSTFGSLIVVGAIALMARHAPGPPIRYRRPRPSPFPCRRRRPPARRARRDRRAEGETQTQRRPHGDVRVLGHCGGLTCAAAIGLDEVLGYTLTPVSDPARPPGTADRPDSASPNPPTPGLQRRRPTNLRVLFTYDPLTRTDVPPGQQAILTSPELRSYLDKHCPLESGCASGRCPLTAGKIASYRFLPANADVSRLAPVWQQTAAAAAGKPVPWMIAVNESGQTVIDQAWPASVEEALALLRKFGGP